MAIFPGILEAVELAYLALLQAQLPGVLSAIQDQWALAGDPRELPPVAFWYAGNIPDTALFNLIQVWPAVTVEAISLVPSATGETSRIVVDSLVAQVYTRGTTPADANKLTHRYTQALLSVLTRMEPPVLATGGRPERLPATAGVGETLNVADSNFVKRGAVRLPLRVAGHL